MSDIAPILISVYNRFDHFKRTVESLKKCNSADKSELYIAIDAPYRDSDVDINNKIFSYSKKIDTFKKVEIFKRQENLGARENISQARNEIFRKYSKYIFSEDDNIFSPVFLDFINEGLNKFQDREDIFGICGFSPLINVPLGYNKKTYLWKGFSSWGVGLWRNRYQKVSFDFNELKLFLKRTENFRKANRIADHYIPNMINAYKNNQVYGDTFIIKYMIENDLSSVFPTYSLVKNIGMDGTGTHFEKLRSSDKLISSIDFKDNFNINIEKSIQKYSQIDNELRKLYRRSFIRKLNIYKKYIAFLKE